MNSRISDNLKAAVLAALDRPRTVADIAALTGYGPGAVRDALHALRVDRRVRVAGHANNAARLWCLPRTPKGHAALRVRRDFAAWAWLCAQTEPAPTAAVSAAVGMRERTGRRVLALLADAGVVLDVGDAGAHLWVALDVVPPC